MAQAEVYKLLKKEKKWMTTPEINKKLKMKGASNNLNKLFKYGEVLKRTVKVKNNYCKEWKIKK